MTKKEIGFITNYDHALCNPKRIRDCYANPSGAKIAAEERIIHEMINRDGHGYTVCGTSCDFFSAGYVFQKDGKSYLCYHTHSHTYTIERR